MKNMLKKIWWKNAGWKLVRLLPIVPCASRLQAETAVWSDNFETNAGSRWTTSSGWSIGTPSTGFSAHSGINCAATGLKGNAPANSEFRLICTNYNGSTNLAIPAANQFPRLRFWQWFDFVNSAGWVEVQVNGTTNWQAITTTTNIGIGYAGNTSGVWSRPSIDLSAYAGTNVQIAFHFLSGGTGYGNDIGWAIDDVALVTGPPVFNDPEGFESNFDDWAVSGGTWAIGKPISGPGQAHGGTNCAGTMLSGYYGYNTDSRLISPLFMVPSNAPLLRLSQWYQFYNALGAVEITTNGVTWQSISTTTISIGSAGVSSGGWTNVNLDLSTYAGSVAKIAFHFQSGGSGYGNAAGWYVDDLSVVAKPVLIVPTNGLSVYPNTTLLITNQAILTPSTITATFVLQSGPTNATFNPVNGIFSWTPTTAQVGTNTVIISVTDTNGLSTTNSFVVQVLPPMALTVSTVQSNLYAGQTFSATCIATNVSSTNATFNYSLAAAPTNAQLNPTNGMLLWAPNSTQAGTNLFSIIATQISNTNPPVPNATNAFFVQVVLPPAPTWVANSAAATTNGFYFSFSSINGVTWQIQASTNLFDWILLTNVSGSNNLLNVIDPAATNYSRRFYRANLP